MSRDFKVKHLTISVFKHSTEDSEKVKTALLNVLPGELRNVINIDERVVSGHYGNEIRILNIRFQHNQALEVLKNIICSLSEADRNVLLMSLSSRVGDTSSHLHLRLSKQDAFLGRLAILDGNDVIKVVTTIDGCRTADDIKAFINKLVKEC